MKASETYENERLEQQPVEGIFFDGKIDRTKVIHKDEKTNNYHQKIIKEDHITITQEPEGKYLCHFTPESPQEKEKPAEKVAQGVFDWLSSHGAVESLKVIGGDSTNSMTGWKGGSLAFLERMMGHKCLWDICSLHTNELPLRHLIIKLDGPTNSKDGFTGPIGKLLSSVDNLPINPDFHAVLCEEGMVALPEEVIKSLSTDQHNCYLLTKAVICG